MKPKVGNSGVLRYGFPGILDVQDGLSALGAFLMSEDVIATRNAAHLPYPDSFVRNKNAAFGQKIFHITEAETEAMIGPHRIADDFRRETVSVVTGSGTLHGRILSVGYPS